MKQKGFKWFGLVVLAMFILSIMPLALAESSTQANTAATENQEDTAIPVDKDKGGINKGNNKEQEIQKEKNSGEKLIAKAKDRLKEIKEQRQLLQEKFQEVKARVAEEKNKVLQIREEVKACTDKEFCEKKKEELKQGVKQHLEKTLDLISSSLERLTGQVENYQSLSEDEKKSALEEINALEADLTAEKEKVTALAQNATNAEVRQAIQDLKKKWEDVRTTQRRIITQLVNSKLGNLVEKHEEIYNAMQLRIDYFTKQGQDAATLKDLAEKYNSKVQELKQDYAMAEQKWQDAKSTKTKEALTAAQEAQQAVRAKMQETKSALKEFVQESNRLLKNLRNVKTAPNANAAENSPAPGGTTVEE